MILLHGDPSPVLIIAFVCSSGTLIYSIVRRNVMRVLMITQAAKRNLRTRFSRAPPDPPQNPPTPNNNNDHIMMNAMNELVEDNEMMKSKLLDLFQKHIDLEQMDEMIIEEPQQEQKHNEKKKKKKKKKNKKKKKKNNKKKQEGQQEQWGSFFYF